MFSIEKVRVSWRVRVAHRIEKKHSLVTLLCSVILWNMIKKGNKAKSRLLPVLLIQPVFWIQRKICYFVLFIARKFALERVAPLVKEMDAASKLDPSIKDGLFEQGVIFYMLHYWITYNLTCIMSVCVSTWIFQYNLYILLKIFLKYLNIQILGRACFTVS